VREYTSCMSDITPEQRRALRAKAHHLRPVVAVGAHGLTPAVVHEIDVALKAHELIKIRVFSDVRAERDALLAQICGELNCAPVQHLGKLLIVWRHNPALHAKRRETASPHAAAHRRVIAKSARSRIAPPAGMPRAPSRRRRVHSEPAPGFATTHDQSRRRRRTH